MESHRYQHRLAFFVILLSLIVFSVFLVLEAISQGFLSIIITASLLLFLFFLVIVMHGREYTDQEAFSIPFALFIANTIKCFLTGNYQNYFSFSLVICCLGTLFFNKRALLRFILISNVFVAAQVIFKAPVIDPALPLEVLFNWAIYLLGSVSAYLATTFAENKNNDAKQAQDSFVGALQSTPDPMLLLDSLNRVTYISNSFMKMIHVEKPMYARGRPVFDLLKDQSLWDLFYDLLTSGDSSQTTRGIILNGQEYFFEIIVSKLNTESKGYFVNLIDITSVMKARFNAEAASRSKSAFLATMSHEIRTPLNAIIGLSEVELQKNLSTDTRDNLEKIHNSGGNLLAIINDILDISKIETGNFELVPVDYDVPSLINDTVQLNIVRIGSKNIMFKLKVDETIPVRLFGDELRVKQIVNNLLSNAFKYTQIGSVTLSISWERRADNAVLIFSVKDTGPGIREKDIPRLFSEYSQLDAQANRNIEGTGLGLSITKNLVHLMDGRIGVESEFGKGSNFTFQISQRIMDETPLGNIIARNLEAFRFKETYRNKSLKLVRSYMPYGKVLVVDDVETNLAVAKGLMTPYGLNIDTASSGPEAIEKIINAGNTGESYRYDVIFMDHMMPGMDGLEAVRIIRNELSGTYGKTVPIVALTANALAGNERMFLAHGCNAFISKPVDVTQLDSVLNTWIRDKQSEETLKKAEMEMEKRKENEQESPSALDDIPVAGLDIVQGRDRYNGEAAYLEILRSWHLHTPALLEKLKDLSPETLPSYSITVHGLKGSSYGIFANDIGKKAAELEAFAKAGDYSSVQAANAAFIEMVESLLGSVGELLKKAADGKEAKPKKPEPDPEMLANLLEAAHRYKSSLMEEILDEIDSFEYESGGELVAWLREQMDNLEYDAICSRLEESASPDGTAPPEGAAEGQGL